MIVSFAMLFNSSSTTSTTTILHPSCQLSIAQPKEGGGYRELPETNQ
jgi:hypothetical protein